MDPNALTMEYLAGAIDAARKKKLAKEAGLLEEAPAEMPAEGEAEVDPEELAALLATLEGGEGQPPPEVPPEEEEV